MPTAYVTGAVAAPWIAESGLATDDRGFLKVRDTLQSIDYESVFAAGDVAVQIEHPRPRAGVFAVRQAPVVAKQVQGIQVLSGSRFDFGIGISPWEEDFAVCEVPWEKRGKRFDEQIDILRGLDGDDLLRSFNGPGDLQGGAGSDELRAGGGDGRFRR